MAPRVINNATEYVILVLCILSDFSKQKSVVFKIFIGSEIWPMGVKMGEIVKVRPLW